MVADIVTRLADADPNISGLALGELVEQGSAAIPTLLQALRSDQVGARRLAMEGLGDIGDAAAVDEARAGLDDSDGQVRSLAAVALARMGDPGALEALAHTLDDWPDLLHSEMSRSAYELPRLGPPALTVAIPLLASDDADDRAKGIWIARAVLDQSVVPDGAELGMILARFDPGGQAEARASAAAAAAGWLCSSGLAACRDRP
ncbi:MAG: HEAT repeat domain-containing protein [Microlunatus sp.]